MMLIGTINDMAQCAARAGALKSECECNTGDVLCQFHSGMYQGVRATLLSLVEMGVDLSPVMTPLESK